MKAVILNSEEMDALADSVERIKTVMNAAPESPISLSEYNGWLLRMKKAVEEIGRCVQQT